MLRDYARERLPAAQFVPLALLLAAAAGGQGSWGWRLVWGWGLSLGLLAQFRLWDDLADRGEDRLRRPGRVLARATRVGPFWAAMAGLGAINATALGVLGLRWLAGFVGLLGLSGWWYGGGREGAGPLARAMGVLLKYPAFVGLVGGVWPEARWGERGLGAALVYACFCAHEVMHDERLRGGGRARLVALGAAGAASGASAAMVVAVAVAGRGASAVVIQAAAGAATVGALLWRLGRLRDGRGDAGAEGVLIACLLQTLSFAR